MPVDPTMLVLALIMLLAYTGEAMVGFGSTVVGVTLGAHVWPIDSLVPVIVPLHVVVNGYVALRHRRHIDTDLLIWRILPFMGVGVLVGLAIFPLIRGPALQKIFAALVVVFTAREFVLLFAGSTARRSMAGTEIAVWQVLAGVIHGIYATGGPLLVYSLTRRALPKAAFRSTLCAVWAVLNAILTATFILNGRIDAVSWKITLALLPVAPLGIFAGQWLHNKVSERLFRICICLLLFVSGMSLLFRT